ncbi:MAG: amidase family protein [Pseudomonadales bacterium]|jgi:aspartyl-tRNA(Asn)/glutamyl-tRNA(Gln) amidotransferase subunit A|nr:amidase family protein [Pseudomonadales bacterium]
MDFRDTTIAELADAVRRGESSAEAIARGALARIGAENGRLNAFVALQAEAVVLDEARAVDAAVARGEDPGPLAGVPVGVKDLEDVRGLRTTYGSALWADAPPAQRDSLLVARMRAAGAVIVGKTNTPEFGCKGATDNPAFGATANPWSLAHSPGGSSGGSSAALAAGLVPLTTGSDGGGSIRIPAAVCGHSGFKATQGRLPLADPSGPTTGLLAVRGPMALCMRDTVLALDALRGDDPRDVFGLPDDDFSWLEAYDERRLPMKAIWAPTLGFAEVDDEVRSVCEAAVNRLADAGVEIVEREALLAPHPLEAWWTLWTAAMARKLGDWVGTPDFERIDPPLQGMIEHGLTLTAADYARAVDACHDYNMQLEAAFEEVVFPEAPLVLSPTCAGRTPRTGEPGIINGRETAAWVEMTFAFNMTRSPVATVHAGCDSGGLPVGLQVIGRQRCDVDVLCAAGCFEDLLGGPGRAPY